MTEPSLVLQFAVVAALGGSTALTGIVGAKIYDRPDPDAAFPFVRYGGDQVIPDPSDCFDRSVEVYVTVDAFSSAVGKTEIKAICGAIVDALDHASLDLSPDWRLMEMLHDGTRYLDEPDGLASHGVVTFRAYLDPV